MSVELNHYLEITRSHVHQISRELETSGKVLTVDLVRKLFYGVDEDNKTLLQVFREHKEQSRKLIGKDFVSKTVQRYETTTRYLEDVYKRQVHSCIIYVSADNSTIKNFNVTKSADRKSVV